MALNHSFGNSETSSASSRARAIKLTGAQKAGRRRHPSFYMLFSATSKSHRAALGEGAGWGEEKH